MRTALARLHRYVGLALAGYLVIAGLTGSVIAFQHEIDGWLNADLMRPAVTGDPRPLAEQQAAVRAAYPGADLLMVAFDRATAFSVLSGGAVQTVFVDPGTARILGARPADGGCCDRRSTVRFLYVLHYSLHGGTLLRLILGAVSLVWFVDCFVGLYLTLPRGRPFWPKWRPAWAVKRGASTARLTFDLHRAGGLWPWALLAIVAFSGAYLNLKGPVFVPIIEATMPVTRSALSISPDRAAPPPALDYAAAEAAARAEATRLGWDGVLQFLWLGREHGLYHAAFEAAAGGRSDLLVDAATGRIVEIRPFAGGTAGDLLMDVQLPLHSGRILGLAGRILVCATGIATVVLSVTGVLIWWRRRKAKR